MLLDTTTRKIQIVLSSSVVANQLTICVSYVDMTASATIPAAAVATSNNTTPVDIVGAPAASTQRKVSSVAIYNADTVAATVTVRYNDNATLYTIINITIPSGYTLQFADPAGWTMISADGIVQVAGPKGANGIAATAGVNSQTGTSYTLAMSDMGKNVQCTNASSITLTVPPDGSVAFPVGAVILFSQGGAGVVTATAGSGVTLRTPNGAATTTNYDARGLEKIDNDTWRVW